ncbi:odorant receptor Or2-like isoform X2 [Sitophilus oryzae]|nr:odorant receptor Or2-like isoform X2 [Sitophilus oryzae]
MIFGAIQLKIFQIRIKKIHETAKSAQYESKEAQYDGDVALVLNEFIRKHQELIEFITNLNKTTKYITFVEFLVSSLNCASIVTSLIKIKSWDANLLIIITYILALTIQIFAYAWAANEIKVHSLGIADALFESDWYHFNKKCRKMVLIMLMRAQKPLYMSIGPFGSMTNETALLMIKASYSYVAFMKD